MAIRNDFTIDWEVSPRVIIVDAPSVECTMQDLLDTLRVEEAKAENIDDPFIVNASGKEPLGGGTKVGLTVALQNAVIGFEARSGPDWLSCGLTGGNLVAFDTDGITTIVPVYPTAFVSIAKTSSSSATLQEQDALNYASYQNRVWVDIASGNSGTVYPVGNREYPVNNFVDAVAIATEKGFSCIGLLSDTTIGAGVDLTGFIIEGLSHVFIDVLLESAAVIEQATFIECIVEGVMDGDTSLKNCVIKDITYLNGHIHNSSLNGEIILGNNKDAYIADCSQLDMNLNPIIDMGGSGQDLVMPNYTGIVNLKNLTGGNKVGIGLNGGQVILDTATVTNGLIHASGTGVLIDELGNRIYTGTWNGGVEVYNELMDTASIASEIWAYER